MISVWDKHFNLANSILVSLAMTIKDLIAKGIWLKMARSPGIPATSLLDKLFAIDA